MRGETRDAPGTLASSGRDLPRACICGRGIDIEFTLAKRGSASRWFAVVSSSCRCAMLAPMPGVGLYTSRPSTRRCLPSARGAARADRTGRKLSLEGWLSLRSTIAGGWSRPGPKSGSARTGTVDCSRRSAGQEHRRSWPIPTPRRPGTPARRRPRPIPPARRRALADPSPTRPLRPREIRCPRPDKLASAYDEIAGPARLSHLTGAGEAHMVDVGAKAATARRAVATALRPHHAGGDRGDRGGRGRQGGRRRGRARRRASRRQARAGPHSALPPGPDDPRRPRLRAHRSARRAFACARRRSVRSHGGRDGGHGRGERRVADGLRHDQERRSLGEHRCRAARGRRAAARRPRGPPRGGARGPRGGRSTRGGDRSVWVALRDTARRSTR